MTRSKKPVQRIYVFTLFGSTPDGAATPGVVVVIASRKDTARHMAAAAVDEMNAPRRLDGLPGVWLDEQDCDCLGPFTGPGVVFTQMAGE